MRTWALRDKTGWRRGPWNDEPDKVQWVDDASGLDCLAVRGPAGAWCGYVGVPEGHPQHGVEYSSAPSYDVHGGLTFSGACREATREKFDKWRASMLASGPEREKYPESDAARRWRECGHLVDDFEGWTRFCEGTNICHIPEQGRPDKVWWFGFDCAHLGDAWPTRRDEYREDGDEYRSLDYVRRECASLADQLAAQ